MKALLFTALIVWSNGDLRETRHMSERGCKDAISVVQYGMTVDEKTGNDLNLAIFRAWEADKSAARERAWRPKHPCLFPVFQFQGNVFKKPGMVCSYSTGGAAFFAKDRGGWYKELGEEPGPYIPLIQCFTASNEVRWPEKEAYSASQTGIIASPVLSCSADGSDPRIKRALCYPEP